MLAAAERWGGGEDERPYLPRAFSIARRARRRGALPARGRRARDAAAVRAARRRGALGRSGRSAAASRSPRRRAAARSSSAAASGSRRWRSCRTRSQAPRRVRDACCSASATARARRRGAAARARVATDDGSVGPPRARHRAARAELERDPHAIVYACGPPPMLEGVRALCERARCPRSSRSRPAWPAASAPAYGCVVPTRGGGYLRVCVDGPVIDAAELERVDGARGSAGRDAA